jgi:hypothetical protein
MPMWLGHVAGAVKSEPNGESGDAECSVGVCV